MFPEEHEGKNFFSFRSTLSALSKRRSHFLSFWLASQRRVASTVPLEFPGAIASRSV